LPDKRDTLGIFQFPWGERSDNATVPTRAPSTSIIFPSRRGQVLPDITEYESSFFDDYEEDSAEGEEEDSGDEFHDSEDDEFDESTLWEIANMLGSKEVPSKNSLLPARREIIEDYDDEEEYDEEDGARYVEDRREELPQARHPEVRFPIEPLAPAIYFRDSLWTDQENFEPEPSAEVELQQPTTPPSNSEIPAEDNSLNVIYRPESQLSSIETREMWSTIPPAGPEEYTPSPVESEPQLPIIPPTGPEEYILSPLQSQPQLPVLAEKLWIAPASEAFASTRFWLADGAVVPISIQPITEPWPTKKRPADLKLPGLTSNDLWVNILPNITLGRSGRRMWNQHNIVAAAPVVASPVASVRMSVGVTKPTIQSRDTTGTWVPMPAVKDIVPTGLFDISNARSDFRTSTALPAALSMARATRLNTAKIPQLKSQELWSTTEIENNTVSWINQSSAIPRELPAVLQTQTSSMWTPSARQEEAENNGLFNINLPQSEYRTTGSSPAAASMTLKTRPIETALPRLRSRNLWRPNKMITVEHHWVNESSVRPTSPSLYSPSSPSDSDRSSILSESASIASASTKASSIWSNTSNTTAAAVKKPSWWQAPQTPRGLPSSPRPNRGPDPRLPQGEPSNRGYPILKEPKPFAARDMWASMDSKASTGAATRKSTEKKASTTSSSDEATNAVTRTDKIVATEAQWDAALAEAIALSKDNRASRASDSDSVSQDVMPNLPAEIPAQGPLETIAEVEAVMEPVTGQGEDAEVPVATVETSSQPIPTPRTPVRPPRPETKINTSVPAVPMISPSNIRQTWRPTSPIQALDALLEDSSMWTAPVKSKLRKQENLSIKESEEPKAPRKRISQRWALLDRLESDAFWKPERSQKEKRHWLRASIVPPSGPAQTWIASATSERTRAQGDMWSPTANVVEQEARMFRNPHTEPWAKIKRSPDSLKEIESQAMWTSSEDLPQSPKNWLLF
jgi:hypothetical protein